jgi:hypothetical protein
VAGRSRPARSTHVSPYWWRRVAGRWPGVAVLAVTLVLLVNLGFVSTESSEATSCGNAGAAAGGVRKNGASTDLGPSAVVSRRVVYASPGDELTFRACSLEPGDTLMLRDGRYGPLTIAGLQGTVGAPITIMAEHDGRAWLDAAGGSHALLVRGSAYVLVQGLSARHGTSDVIRVTQSDHVVLRRVTGADAGPGNVHIFSIMFGNTDIVVEDSAGWGNGRYVFVAYHSDRVTFRRTWARWTSQSDWSPAPRSCYGVYGSSHDVLENNICEHDVPDRNSADFFTALWETSDGPRTDHNTYRGLIFVDNWEGLGVNSSAGQGVVIENSLFLNTRKQGQYTTTADHGHGVSWGSPYGGVVNNSTFVGNEVGVRRTDGDVSMTNDLFYGNGQAVEGAEIGNHAASFGDATTGTAPRSTGRQVEPGFDTAKYGRGAFLFIPPDSPLKGAGVDGQDIGANVIYQYEDGRLTYEPLWPWPMEDRIKAERGISVTWESGGGLWRTLDGVYPPP